MALYQIPGDITVCNLVDEKTKHIISCGGRRTIEGLLKECPIPAIDLHHAIFDQLSNGPVDQRKNVKIFLKFAKEIDELIRVHERIFVYCKNGRSRSPCVIAAFFMVFRGFSYNHVRTWFTSAFRYQRPVAYNSSPNTFPNFNKFRDVLESMPKHQHSFIEATKDDQVNASLIVLHDTSFFSNINVQTVSDDPRPPPLVERTRSAALKKTITNTNWAKTNIEPPQDTEIGNSADSYVIVACDNNERSFADRYLKTKKRDREHDDLVKELKKMKPFGRWLPREDVDPSPREEEKIDDVYYKDLSIQYYAPPQPAVRLPGIIVSNLVTDVISCDAKNHLSWISEMDSANSVLVKGIDASRVIKIVRGNLTPQTHTPQKTNCRRHRTVIRDDRPPPQCSINFLRRAGVVAEEGNYADEVDDEEFLGRIFVEFDKVLAPLTTLLNDSRKAINGINWIKVEDVIRAIPFINRSSFQYVVGYGVPLVADHNTRSIWTNCIVRLMKKINRKIIISPVAMSVLNDICTIQLIEIVERADVLANG